MQFSCKRGGDGILVLGQSLMFISTTGILLYAKVCPLYVGMHCCCLHINYIVYVGSSDPTCVQNFRSIPLTIFEILRFKLKKDDNDRRICLQSKPNFS